jgi:hypothetical protein
MTSRVATRIGTEACPKCGQLSATETAECPRCGVIKGKIAQVEQRRAEREQRASLGEGMSLGRLAAARELKIKQQLEKLETFTGIETRNRYAVTDGDGNQVLFAEEEAGQTAELLARLFLKAARPFRLQIETLHGEPVIHIDRPFRFYFHELEVRNAEDVLLGTVEKQFSLLNRRYAVTDRLHGKRYEIVGPLWRPWTFRILRDGVECGVIRKRWGGTVREVFTDADAFGIELPPEADSPLKAVFLGAVFLIDFVHFEDNHNN